MRKERNMKKKPWSGRFKEKTNARFEQFSESISYDQRLAFYDIRAGLAHVEMLAKKKIILRKDAKRIIQGLKKVEKEVVEGRFVFRPELEDVHMNIESRLFELLGEVAGKLHTGRSRNDLVLTDVRLWLKDSSAAVISLTKSLIRRASEKAENNLGVIMPGFTHTREAQPVLFSHWLMAYAEMFLRDCQRFMEVFNHTNISPLGSGALAGNNYPINREFLAKRLGFAAVTHNSMDAVSDRDFIIDFLSAASILMMHLSRLCEELVWFSAEGYGFYDLPESLCTGSSIMPNKKNPDAAELVRGKSGRVYGRLMAMLTVMKGTPLAYNRDFQEDKEAMFDAADTVKNCLEIAELLIAGLEPVPHKMREACARGFILATDLADYLVKKGLGFRQAHHAVGALVKYCEDKGRNFEELKLAEFKKHSELFEKDVYKLLSLEQSVRAKDTTGGTAPVQVQKQIERIRQLLKEMSTKSFLTRR
jgi:argininosuccinate lyase